MQDERLVGEFTHQAESFNRSQAANARETLEALVELAAPQPGERWLEAACGPGVVSRALAPRAGSVHGVDLTPAMVELARREAAGLDNATFAVGDATALDDADGSYDGALARFTIHHVPVPARLVEELARVVRPGGHLLLSLNGQQQAEALLEGDERERYDAGELAQLWPERTGTNACTVFHPALYRRDGFAGAAGLEIVDERVDAVCNAGQDLLLLRKG